VLGIAVRAALAITSPRCWTANRCCWGLRECYRDVKRCNLNFRVVNTAENVSRDVNTAVIAGLVRACVPLYSVKLR
jgi:hypothetical protein